MEILKVSGKSNPNAVAGALVGIIREHGIAGIHAIGAAAVNQSIKAVAIARLYLAGTGLDLICMPSFHEVQIGEEERTAIRLEVESREVESGQSEESIL